MSSRTRTFTTGTSTHEYAHEQFDLESYSDDELETLLFQDDEQVKKKGPLNLPTLAGLSMVLVGIMYMLNEFLAVGPNLGGLVQVLPVIAGLLIVAMGFGLIRMDPKQKKKKVVRSKERKKTGTPHIGISFGTAHEEGRVIKDRPARRLKKSRDRKVAGVAAGIAEYFGWDPTIVRVGFVVGTLISSGFVIPLYIALAIFLPKPDAMTLEERLRVIRDS